jgi:tRNA 2-thiouridine synthesizing protein C
MKNFLFVQAASPHSSMLAKEGLDAILMGSAFCSVSVMLTGDALFQIHKNQHAGLTQTKPVANSFKALKEYGVENVYCSEKDLSDRGLSQDDLVIGVTSLDTAECKSIMSQFDIIVGF